MIINNIKKFNITCNLVYTFTECNWLESSQYNIFWFGKMILLKLKLTVKLICFRLSSIEQK